MTDANPLGVDEPAPRADNQDPALFGPTPWQTVGPFFHYGLPWRGGADLVGGSDLGARPELFDEAHWVINLAPPRGPVTGEPVTLAGRVLDAQGASVRDAMVEIWQADAAGRYASQRDARAGARTDIGFIGFGRAAMQDDGGFRFLTIRPGRTPGPGGVLQAPHIAMSVFGRGVLKRLITRVYFDGDSDNAEDPVLSLVPPARRGTLLATPAGDGEWRFDIRLSGDGETVFFEV